MKKENLIPARAICTHHHIELSFIHSLHASGLIAIVMQEEEEYIPEDELPGLEKLLRLHYEMDINLEGIEAITHLLEKLTSMQEQITLLRNRLRVYEAE